MAAARRRHDVQAGVRQAGACSRSARSRSIRAIRRTSGSAPARRGRATRCRSATASTSRPTAARPGRTWGCPSPSASRGSSCIRSNSNVVYACVPGKLWSDSPDRGLYKTVDGGKTLVARAQGPEPLDRLLERDDGSEEPRRAARRHVGLPPQGLDVPLRRRGSRRAERQRACSARPTAASTWKPLADDANGPAGGAVGPRRGRVRAVATRTSSTR